jgi:DNA mismatch endonuclease (patch repair protein)
MPDVVSPEVRSRMMAGIRGKNTRPELILRKGLHARGLRFRIHDRRLPGKPDLVFPRWIAVIFVHGCFWHGHDCPLFKWPSTRPEFWRSKIERNREIDQRAIEQLSAIGWRHAVVWECATKGPGRLQAETILDSCARWLYSDEAHIEISGSRDDRAREPVGLFRRRRS